MRRSTVASSSGRRAIILQWIAAPLVTLSLAAASAAQSPDVAFHDLEWYVHDSLIDANNPLSSYQDLIEQASEDAGVILQGNSGPVDSPCCTDFNSASVSSFSDQGGNTWDSVDSTAEFENLSLVDPTGHRAFIVGGITFCGVAGNPIGCATTPFCNFAPVDLTIVIDIRAETVFDVLAGTLAHERGHNMCLGHTFNDSCDVMKSSSGGDCLSASECVEFRNRRTSTAGTCACQSASGVLEDDAVACSETAVTGICSGGICGEIGSDASVRLVASAGTAASQGDTPNDPLIISGIPGGWTDLGEFSSNYTPQGLAFADDRGVTYAVSPTAGDDVLLQIDPTNGSDTLVGSITGVRNLVGLAYDPGPTSAPSDDRLLAINFVDFLIPTVVYEIDPDDGSVTQLGSLTLTGLGSSFNGLAYDSKNQRLYTSSGFTGGIFEIDLTPCCFTAEVSLDGPARTESGIAYSSATNRIYVIGSTNGPRTFFDSLDADAFAAGTVSSGNSRALQGFTLGGLAATSIPEPDFGLCALAAGLCLWGVRRVRSSRH